MPTVITDDIPHAHRFISLTGSHSDGVNGEPFAQRVVDISDMCARRGQILIKYGGIDHLESVVQIQDRPVPHIDEGQTLNYIFPIDDKAGPDAEALAQDKELMRKAKFLGCDAMELAGVIFQYLPPVQPEPF